MLIERTLKSKYSNLWESNCTDTSVPENHFEWLGELSRLRGNVIKFSQNTNNSRKKAEMCRL